MLDLRPIVVDETFVALGGNMRYRALCAIASMSYDDMAKRLVSITEYTRKTEAEKQQLIDFWEGWKQKPTATIVKATTLSEDERKAFVIKDNVSFGAWDMDTLANEWDSLELNDWGVDVWQDTGDGGEDVLGYNIQETEKLSDPEFAGMYYEPKKTPKLHLLDCVDLEKFDAKMRVIDNSTLSEKQKEIMRLFAYRFIKINFEMVANYYAFNASEDEKAIIERLRMVLVDGSIDGFIEDDMLRIRGEVMNNENYEP